MGDKSPKAIKRKTKQNQVKQEKARKRKQAQANHALSPAIGSKKK